MQVLRAVNKIVWYQQHLSANQTMRGQMFVVLIHQLTLSNSSKRLQSLSVGWALSQTECTYTPCDCTRRNNDYFVALAPHTSHLLAQCTNCFVLDGAVLISY